MSALGWAGAAVAATLSSAGAYVARQILTEDADSYTPIVSDIGGMNVLNRPYTRVYVDSGNLINGAVASVSVREILWTTAERRRYRLDRILQPIVKLPGGDRLPIRKTYDFPMELTVSDCQFKGHGINIRGANSVRLHSNYFKS